MSDLPNVYQGMAAVTAALSHIPKQRSQGVSYEFRGIDAVMAALHQPLADNGLFLAPRVLDDWRAELVQGTPDRKGNPRHQTQVLFRIEVDVYASDGSSVTIGPGLAQSHDYGDKAAYQAQQNAIKYLLLEAFCIPVDEPDMDGRTPDAAPVPDFTVLTELIADAQRVGVEGDFDATVEWAEQSDQNLVAAINRIRRAIAAKEAA